MACGHTRVCNDYSQVTAYSHTASARWSPLLCLHICLTMQCFIWRVLHSDVFPGKKQSPRYSSRYLINDSLSRRDRRYSALKLALPPPTALTHSIPPCPDLSLSCPCNSGWAHTTCIQLQGVSGDTCLQVESVCGGRRVVAASDSV